MSILATSDPRPTYGTLEDECTRYAQEHGRWYPKSHFRGVDLGEWSEQDFEMEMEDGRMVTFTAQGYQEDYVNGHWDQEPYQPEAVVSVDDIEVRHDFSDEDLLRLGMTEYFPDQFGVKCGSGFWVEVNYGFVELVNGQERLTLTVNGLDDLRTMLTMMGHDCTPRKPGTKVMAVYERI